MTPSEILEKYLPAHTKIDHYNGQAMISFIAFDLSGLEIDGNNIPFPAKMEKIGLQFYVKRFDGANWQKGIVEISEIAGQSLIDLLSAHWWGKNLKAFATNNEFSVDQELHVQEYNWTLGNKNQSVKISAEKSAILPKHNGEEEFVLDRYFYYQDLGNGKTGEYKISHPRWRIFPIQENEVDIDFTMQFGAAFSHLSQPHSIIMAEGSRVSVQDFHVVES